MTRHQPSRSGVWLGTILPLRGPVLRVAFCVLLALHGAIHLLGFVKALGLAEVPQLRQSIAAPIGWLWLGAGLGFMASAALFAVSARFWWGVAAPALLLSIGLILGAWADAKFGMIPNLLVLVALVPALADMRSSSLRAIYEREVQRRLVAHSASDALIVEADLAVLPAPIQTYLRRAGVVGKPRVHDVRARFTGGLRSKSTASWMSIRAEQHDFFDQPARIFLVHATLYGIPFDALHVYADSAASMRVRIASLFDLLEVRGPEMTQSETVTLFNDMCLLAPASLLGANVRWTAQDQRTVSAVFTNAGHSITAVLSFDASGDLVEFASADRYQSDGKSHKKFPWHTPVRDYRDYHGVRLAALGDAMWREPQQDWAYARFELQEVEYNVSRP